MDIHHIRYFLALCETMNFTLAAEKCHVAQPALSRAVQQLEEEVGGPLIRRERGRNQLTDLGMMMKPRFESVLVQLGEAKKEARRFLTLEKASINLGIMCTVGPTRFTGLLVHFAAAHPDVTLQFYEGIPPNLSARLKSGEIDVALMASPQGFGEGLASEVIYRERFVLAFPVGHRFAGMNAIPFSAIRGETYLRRLNCEYRQHLSDIADAQGTDVHLGCASEREDWIQNLVAGGMGVCMIPEFSAVAAGVQTRPLIDPEVWRDVCLVTRQGHDHAPAVRGFIEAVRGYPFPESRFVEKTA